ncbi:hypothetical protein LXL04_029816 [Taraxacum kok-saghyz]
MNHMNGTIAPEMKKLPLLEHLLLSHNAFTGETPEEIGECVHLGRLELSYNNFTGEIPESFGKLVSLRSLYLNNNKLSGEIPSSLGNYVGLADVNLTHNGFNGHIPPGLLSAMIHNAIFFRSPGFLAVFYVGMLTSVLLAAIYCVIGWQYLKRILSSNAEPETKSPPEMTQKFPRITYKELSEATNGFDEQRLLGSGDYGRVYLGSLPDGTQIAVKVLQLQTECQVLKRIRHRNLIRIITASGLPDFKALVLPYMANGSLDRRLYPDSGLGSSLSDLNLIQIVNICSDKLTMLKEWLISTIILRDSRSDMANGSLDRRLYPDSGLGSSLSDLNLIQIVNICSDKLTMLKEWLISTIILRLK